MVGVKTAEVAFKLNKFMALRHTISGCGSQPVRNCGPASAEVQIFMNPFKGDAIGQAKPNSGRQVYALESITTTSFVASSAACEYVQFVTHTVL